MSILANPGRAVKILAFAASVPTALLSTATASLAAAGRPVPGGIGMQEPVTPVGRDIEFFHNVILTPIIFIISLFVLALIIWVITHFNATKNPNPSRTTHNSLLEVAWTVLPVLVLVVIAVFSFPLLTKELVLPKADITMKVTGHQWYWTYSYPADQGGGFDFDSNVKKDDELKEGDLRLLSVDNEAVVPVGKIVRVIVTSTDVIHSFTVPSFGVRIDAVPGRANETWFRADVEGIYYGQCSKLCGKDHAFMPIAFRVVSEAQYAAWLADAKKKFASSEQGSPALTQEAALSAQQ